MTTNEVLVIGAVGVGAYLLYNSAFGQVVLKPRNKSPLSGIRDVALDARDIVNTSKDMFDAGKSLWNSFTGLFDSTNETAPIKVGRTQTLPGPLTYSGTSFVNKLANTSDWIL